jgi:hypothetical protein
MLTRTASRGRYSIKIRSTCSANTDACGRSFAVLSTQVSAAGLRLQHHRLSTRGIMLEVSRDAAAAGEE